MSGHFPCSLCLSRPATRFCYCLDCATLFCDSCILSHYDSLPGRPHVPLPIASYGQHTREGYFLRLRKRVEELPARKEFIRKNVDTAAEFHAKFTEKVKKLMTMIWDEAQNILQTVHLDKERMEKAIETAISEAETTIVDDDCPQISLLGQWLRDPAVNLSKLALFSYTIEDQVSLPLASCYSCHYFQNSVLPTYPVLASIWGSQLETYNLETGAITGNYRLSVAFTQGTVYCPVDLNRVLCIGGSPYTKQTMWLDIASRGISATMDMDIARGYPGVVKVDTHVYVFGGNNPSITACESFDSRTCIWSSLPSMSIPRRAFNPCIYKSDIYLIELMQYQGAERFHLHTKTYFAVQLALPASVQHAASFLVEEELVFLTTEGWMYGCDLGTGRVRKEKLRGVFDTSLALVPSGAPYLYGKYVYYVDFYSGKLRVFDVLAKELH